MSKKIAFDAIDANSSDDAHEKVVDEEEGQPAPRCKHPKKILPYKALRTLHVYRTRFPAFLEIRKYQKTTSLLLAHRPVNGLGREILQELRPGFRLRKDAVDALNHAVEDYAIKLLMECNALAHHAEHITITPNDLRLALHLRGARN